MKQLKPTFIATVIVFMAAPLLSQYSGRQIAEKAYNIEDGTDFSASVVMKIVKPGGKMKRRDLVFYRKDYGRDNRTLIKFRLPADVRGTAFLTWNSHGNESSQWIYLPALGRVKRIVASKKSSSFMKSDFSYEDLARRPLEKDSFKFLKEESFDGHRCYVVEARARDTREALTKRVYWIRKDNYVIMKVDSYNRSGAPVKRYRVITVRVINNIWTVVSSRMENLKTRRYTTFTMSNIRYNSSIPQRIFTVQGMIR